MTEEDFKAIGWMSTWSGARVTPLAIDVETIHLDDIAHALDNLCRYGGHTAGFISVADHSLAVHDWVEEQGWEAVAAAGGGGVIGYLRTLLTAVLHDASEAYIGDIIRPLKRHPSLAIISEVEDSIHAAIASKFGSLWPHPGLVVEADDAILRHELATIRNDASYRSRPSKELFKERVISLCQQLDIAYNCGQCRTETAL